ncbi:MAG TPA: tripartite tricarboxylate transporter substrate binding protein, partial [Devosia sp.]|nr:tripartite tricarboxylate transporter substrate binding protein [Devosia sp.]
MSFKIMAAALVAAVSLGMPQVQAQDQWAPERPFSLVVAFAAGGGTDIVARTAASVLSQQLG